MSPAVTAGLPSTAEGDDIVVEHLNPDKTTVARGFTVQAARARGCHRLPSGPREHEREMISKRTTEGLAAAKARGPRPGKALPGNRTNLREAQAKGHAAARAAADRFARKTLPIVREIQASGATTLRAVAAALAARGVPTARGGQWSAAQVSNLLARA